MEFSLSSLALALSILLSTYLTHLSATPPNPTPYDSKVPDSLSPGVTPRSIFIRRAVNVSLGIYHASLCLLYPTLFSSDSSTLVCPHPEHLSRYLFTWSPWTCAWLVVLFAGCWIRLHAFSSLGKEFTFRLRVPRKLVTTGVYSYIQHPSYTGKFMIVAANMALLQRVDAGLGCWVPGWVVGERGMWVWRVAGVGLMVVIVRLGRKRVSEEENMLKESFGEEWEAWHGRTKRFLPGLY